MLFNNLFMLVRNVSICPQFCPSVSNSAPILSFTIPPQRNAYGWVHCSEEGVPLYPQHITDLHCYGRLSTCGQYNTVQEQSTHQENLIQWKSPLQYKQQNHIITVWKVQVFEWHKIFVIEKEILLQEEGNWKQYLMITLIKDYFALLRNSKNDHFSSWRLFHVDC